MKIIKLNLLIVLGLTLLASCTSDNDNNDNVEIVIN